MQDALAPSVKIDMFRLLDNIEKRFLEDNSHYLKDYEIEKRKQVLVPLIREAERRGATIIIFEMPLNEHLKYLPGNNQT